MTKSSIVARVSYGAVAAAMSKLNQVSRYLLFLCFINKKNKLIKQRNIQVIFISTVWLEKKALTFEQNCLSLFFFQYNGKITLSNLFSLFILFLLFLRFGYENGKYFFVLVERSR